VRLGLTDFFKNMEVFLSISNRYMFIGAVVFIVGCAPPRQSYNNQYVYSPRYEPVRAAVEVNQEPDNKIEDIPTSRPDGEWPAASSFSKEYKKLKSQKLEKDKYESDENYRRRIATAKTNAIVGSSIFRVEYDANSKIISVSQYSGEGYFSRLGEALYHENNDYSFYGHVVSSGSKDVGSYTASNAFGATTNVSVVSSTNDYFVFGKQKSISGPVSLQISPDCKADPQELKKSGDYLTVEYLVNPVAPFVFESSGYKSPTFSSPTRESTENRFIRADLVAARLKYFKTEKILNCSIKIVHASLF